MTCELALTRFLLHVGGACLMVGYWNIETTTRGGIIVAPDEPSEAWDWLITQQEPYFEYEVITR